MVINVSFLSALSAYIVGTPSYSLTESSACFLQVQPFCFSKKMLAVSFYCCIPEHMHSVMLHVFIYSVIFWAHEVLMGPIPFGHLYLLPADIAHRLEMVRIMIQRLQCNVFMLSYRGYALVAFLIHKFFVLLLSLI